MILCADGPEMKHYTKLLVIIPALLAGLVAGCDSARNNSHIESPTITSPEGIRYKIVTIEGKRFVATQGYNYYWTLAGPLN